jgi:hypothetical protein
VLIKLKISILSPRVVELEPVSLLDFFQALSFRDFGRLIADLDQDLFLAGLWAF